MTGHKIDLQINATQLSSRKGLFVEINKLILKFKWKHKGPGIQRKLENIGASVLHDFKTYSKVTIINKL